MPAVFPKLIHSPREGAAVQVTSFSVDAYARQVCNTLDEACEIAHGIFDIVIIGSGMYGGYAADKLYQLSASGRKPRILVVDAGHVVLQEHVDNVARIAKDEGIFEQGGIRGFPYLDARPLATRPPGERHHYCIGGKSIAWGKWAPRLTLDDLGAPWPPSVSQFLASNKGYPMVERETGTAEETAFIRGILQDRLLARATAVAAEFGNLTSPSIFPQYQPPIAAQGSSPASGLFSFDAFSSLVLLLDAVREDIEAANGDNEKRRLFVVPRCRVHRLDHQGGRVVGLHLLAGEPMAPRYLPVSHRTRVVMALNSMESTRLALVSNLPEPSAEVRLMGRNLMGHLRSGFTVRMRRAALGAALPEVLQVGALHVQGSEGGRRFHLQIFAAADPGHNPFRMIYKMMPDVESMNELLAAQKDGYISLTVLTVGEMIGRRDVPVGTAGVSGVRIATASDDPEYQDVIAGVVVPKIFADWQRPADQQDFWTAMDTTAFRFVQRIAGQNNGFEIRHPDGQWREAPPANLEVYRDSLSSTFHEAGTLWMGDDPATSVTGPTGRFHRVANLYCVDQAVFPTVGSANPVLTGLAITRMIVEGILAELGNRKPEETTPAGKAVAKRRTPEWNQ